MPRPETELLVKHVLHGADESPRRVIDFGTGSGVIAISLALERPLWALYALDVSSGALAVARANGGVHGVSSVVWRQQDDLLGFEQVDIVVSNPPYIAEGDLHLQGDGVCCEPRQALVSGADGLTLIRLIIEQSRGFAFRWSALVRAWLRPK